MPRQFLQDLSPVSMLFPSSNVGLDTCTTRDWSSGLSLVKLGDEPSLES